MGGEDKRGKAAEHGAISSPGGNHHCLISSAPFQTLLDRKDPDNLLVYPSPVLPIKGEQFPSAMTWRGCVPLIRIPMDAAAGL